MKSICVYHATDSDGVVGASVVLSYIYSVNPEKDRDDIIFLGGNHKPSDNKIIIEKIMKCLDAEETVIYIVDYSFPPEVFQKICSHKNCSFIGFFDHHISAIKAYQEFHFDDSELSRKFKVYDSFLHKNIYCGLKKNISGCKIAFQSLNSVKLSSRLIDLVSIFDTWDKESPDWKDALSLNMGLQKYVKEKKIEFLSEKIGDDDFVRNTISKGSIIQEYIDAKNADYAERASFDLHFEGLLFRAINATPGGSFVVQTEATEKHDGLLQFSYIKNAWSVSLYQNAKCAKEHDLSIIATKYGGGGHAGACGFTVQELPFKLSEKGELRDESTTAKPKAYSSLP